MMMNSSYQRVLHEIAELGIWGGDFINIDNAENLSCVEFEFYRSVFKKKFEEESEGKKKLIEAAFEAARKYCESICKNIQGLGKKK